MKKYLSLLAVLLIIAMSLSVFASCNDIGTIPPNVDGVTNTTDNVPSESTTESGTGKPSEDNPTESAASEPESSEPESTEPATSEPESTEPESSKPATSEPESSKPESSKPESSEPESSEPESSEPESTEPESSVPESSEPESSVPESSVPESSEPESTEPESSEPESTEPESSKPATSEPESSEPESSEPESSEPESSENTSTETTPPDPPCDHKDTDNNGYCDDCEIYVIINFNLFGINDLHGKLSDSDSQPGVNEITAFLMNAKKNMDNTLIFSSGDMWQGTAESGLTFGNMMTEWMNYLDFEFMTIGNHEFDWGDKYISQNAELAQFPFLAINIYDSDTNRRADFCDSSVMVDLGEIQIGFIGAIGDCYSSISGEMSGGYYSRQVMTFRPLSRRNPSICVKRGQIL